MIATKYVGKMYTAERVCGMLNTSSEELQELVHNNVILRLTNNRGQAGYLFSNSIMGASTLMSNRLLKSC